MLQAIRSPGMGSYQVSILFLLLFFAASHLAPTPLAAAGKKRATLILDLSSSMSGALASVPKVTSSASDTDDIPGVRPRKIGKKTSRIAETRKALGKAYRDFSPRVNLGIVAFGSKKAGSCSDIQTIKPIGAINPKRYRASTNALTPTGVSPITAAIQHAANNADYKNTINSFILITDSVDSCSANPCKLGGELRNSGANLTVHVIAIDLPKSQQKNLRCLAGHTRGHFFAVSSKQQLTRAVYSAFNGVSITRHLQPEPAPSAETIAEAEKSGGGSVDMTALITGDIPLPRRKPKAPPKPKSDVAPDDKPGAAPAKIETAAKEKTKDPATPAPVKTKIPPPPIPQMTTMVPQPAQPAADAMPAAAPSSDGQLRGVARIIEGSAPLGAGVSWTVYTAKNSAPDKKVASSLKGAPEFNLPTGEYIINASRGYAKASTTASVTAGQVTNMDLIFNAGGLKLTSVIGGKVTANTSSAIYTVKNKQGRTIARNLNSSQIIYLNSDDYTVISRYGSANSIVTAKIKVQPGKLTEATLNHSAGRIAFKLTTKRGEEPLTGVTWKFKKSDGETVASSEKATPKFIFANGTYKATAKHDGKVYRSSFIVRPGEDKVKEITTE